MSRSWGLTCRQRFAVTLQKFKWMKLYSTFCLWVLFLLRRWGVGGGGEKRNQSAQGTRKVVVFTHFRSSGEPHNLHHFASTEELASVEKESRSEREKRSEDLLWEVREREREKSRRHASRNVQCKTNSSAATHIFNSPVGYLMGTVYIFYVSYEYSWPSSVT